MKSTLHYIVLLATYIDDSLTAVLLSWACDSAPVEAAIDLDDREQRREDTTHSLASNEPSTERKAPDLPALGPPATPSIGDVSTNDHGNRIVRLWDDETESNGVPVGDPLAVPGWDERVLDDDGDDSEYGEANGKVSRSGRDRERRGRDGCSDDTPGGNGGETECRALDFEIGDARIGSGEEDEEPDAEPDSDYATEDLGEELCAGACAEEMTSLQVSSHVDTVRGSLAGDGTGEQVRQLRLFDRNTLGTGGTSDDKLAGLCNGADGVDVGRSRGLYTNEGEHEGQEEGENANADVHVERELADDEGGDDREEETASPHPHGNLLVVRSRVIQHAFLFWANIGEGKSLAASGPGVVVVPPRATSRLERAIEDGRIDAEFGKRLTTRLVKHPAWTTISLT